MQTQLPSAQHAAVSMLISEVERILCAGLLPPNRAQSLRVKAMAACGECGITPPIAEQDNEPAGADYEPLLAEIGAIMGGRS